VTKTNVLLGKIIAGLRRSAGLSQEELADRSAIHRTYVSQIERGLKSPTIAIMMRISKALGTPPSKIMRLLEQQIDGT
jgi:transcriptional regulator with XRE-family HTH domain